MRSGCASHSLRAATDLAHCPLVSPVAPPPPLTQQFAFRLANAEKKRDNKMWQRLRPVPWRLLHNFCGNLTLGRCSYAPGSHCPFPYPSQPALTLYRVCAQKLVEKNRVKKKKHRKNCQKSNLKKVKKREGEGRGWRDEGITTTKRSYNFWQAVAVRGEAGGGSYKRER